MQRLRNNGQFLSFHQFFIDIGILGSLTNNTTSVM